MQTSGEQSYKVIYADPPWSFKTWSDKGKGRSPKYRTMSIPQIKALPVEGLAHRDCVLFMWTTGPMLPASLEVMACWGFTYKTLGFTWAKPAADGFNWRMGMGFWTRANAELCLLGTRGLPKRLAADVPSLIVDRVREHSRKPDETRKRIQRLCQGPYVELFARQRVPGWDVAFSDEPEKFGGSYGGP
jgi:N6-adenosine-specific RNA methylase IME4